PLRALSGHRIPFDCARYAPLLCRSMRLNIIRRPPHFGRSGFLATVADALDALSPRPRKGPWPNPVTYRRPHFNFNAGVILHLDMGRLTYETYEDLEDQTASLLHNAIVQFMDKYQAYLKITEEERSDVLGEDPMFDPLYSTMRLAICAEPDVFTYICIDNYTAPYERARHSEDWPQITEILDRALFHNLRALVAAAFIHSGILVGSSEMDGDPMALLTYYKEVDEWGNDIFGPGDGPTPIPFVGALMDYAADRTHDSGMQAAVGVSQDGVMALGRAVFGDEARAVALWGRVSELPSHTFRDCPDAERVWARGDVLEILHDMVGTRTVKNDLNLERSDDLVAS
ncbi:hypothetical protein EV121DRAFT_174375, partial [Schizophyllum commune]